MRHRILIDLPIDLTQGAQLTLTARLAEQIRRLILDGRLRPGALMPSSRALCESLKISRSTVVESYDHLKAEGYLETRGGLGTAVSRRLPPPPVSKPEVKNVEIVEPSRRLITGISALARRVQTMPKLHPTTPICEITFRHWDICYEVASPHPLAQIYAKLSKKDDQELFEYASDPLGYPLLRECIVRSLYRSRGVKCAAEQILVVNGLQQALSLIARIHVERGDLLAVENPGYVPIVRTFEFEGATAYPINVDADGIQVERLEAANERFRLVYTTPTHQFPSGVRLSLTRRLQLLSWAAKTGTLIVEDEHDSEFCFEQQVPALKALDDSEQVIFVGTFVKVLFPSMSLAYMVLPRSLVSIYSQVRELSSDQPSTLLQASLAQLMHEGLLSRHVRKLRHVYAQRRSALLQALAQYFGNRATVSGENAGLHLMVRFGTGLSTEEIVTKAAEAGVGLTSTEGFYFSGGVPPNAEFILGYGNLQDRQIEEGVRRLSLVLTA